MSGFIHRQGLLGTRTRKEISQDEVAKNARLLTRAGYIHKHMAGVYEFLPLGFRSFSRIMNIIRDEMNMLGAHEVLMPSLQNPDLWKTSGRWGIDEVWFKSEISVGGEVGFGWTHEEDVTAMMSHHISSHKDLPVYLYQMQTKFRSEKRAKSGILRTREFVMKDLYSFCRDEKEHEIFYNACAEAYITIFKKCGIGTHTYKTFASGGDFSEFSHEFQTVCDAGEDIVYVHKKENIAINREVYTDEVLSGLGYLKDDFFEHKAVEVGNIFSLGTKYSEAFNLSFDDREGVSRPVVMGSYGIGPARLLGVIVELYGSENGMILPRSIAPYDVHIIQIEEKSEMVQKMTKEMCNVCVAQGLQVLVDDRSTSTGEKFVEADLIGIADRFIVSERSIASGGVEYKERHTDTTLFGIPNNMLSAYKKHIV